MLAYHQDNPEECATELGKVWKAVWNLLDSSDGATRKSAAEVLTILGQCFTTSLIKAAVKEKGSDDPKSTLGKIIAQTMKALDSLAYARAIPDVLAVASSLIVNLRSRNGSRKNTTAAEQLLLPLVVKVADLRVQKTFEHKETADATLGTAMRILGPAVLLHVLPLNLEAVDRYAPVYMPTDRPLTVVQAGRSGTSRIPPAVTRAAPPISSWSFPGVFRPVNRENVRSSIYG